MSENEKYENYENIDDLLLRQRNFFKSGKTFDLEFRKANLKKLYDAVCRFEPEINQALKADLGKSSFESYMCETGMLLTEITYMRKHLKKFARPKTVRTPLAQFPSRSFRQPMPYGNVLIMSPWNYPLLLTLEPLVDAIAAGNTAVLKPSAYAPNAADVIKKIVDSCFAPECVAVVTGGRAENAALLGKKFDFIFFTGSQAVGKEVLRHAAEHLTPAVLELGGKSPCIVERSADLELAARRIVFGKYLNCGQTCVAPDYVLCDVQIRDALVAAVKEEIRRQYGEKPMENPDYGKIINQKHFERICGLIEPEKVVCGGGHSASDCRIEPTVMVNVSRADKVMQEEIFGPILPILTYDDFERMVAELNDLAKPLALYIFSSDKQHIERMVSQVPSGGGCVNDTIIHLATSEMGFGGVGESGMGAYHGQAGFDAFSHIKSVVDKKTWLDLPMRYAPYNGSMKEKLLRMFMK